MHSKGIPGFIKSLIYFSHSEPHAHVLMEEIKQKEGVIVHVLSTEIIERPSVLLECYGFLLSDHHLAVLCHLRGSDSSP